MKVLVLALSGIGDALMFSPALKYLKSSLPNSQIDMLVMFKGAEALYKNNPNISNLIYFDFLKEGPLKSLKFVLSLRKKYNVTINVYPSNRREYNIISSLLGAKVKLAVKYKRMNFQNLGWLNNFFVNEDDHSHNVQTNIKMIERFLSKTTNEISRLEIFTSSEDDIYANEYLNKLKISENDFVIGIHPGCATLKNHIKRRWEPEKFIELSKRLIKQYSCRILLFGGPEEQPLRNEILNGIQSEFAHSVETQTLLQSAAIMKRCNLFITNDSALMHIASALSLNVAAIIGPTNPYYIHPWKTNYRIISLNLDCSPCFFYSPKPLTCNRDDVKFKCIKELTVDYAYASLESFIQQIKGK